MKKRIGLIFTVMCLILCVTFLLFSCDRAGEVKYLAATGFEFDGESKTVYVQGEEFRLEGVTLVLNLKKGEEIRIPVTEDMIEAMPDLSTPGTKEVTVRYNGEVYSFTIEVTAASDPHPVGGSLSGYKTEYYENDAFTLADTVLLIGNERISVTDDMLKAAPDMAAVGEQTLYIVYGGEEYAFTINVQAVEEVSSDFTGLHNTYMQGDSFSYDDFSLIITYNNQKSITLSEKDLIVKSLPDLTVPGVQHFVVTYAEKDYQFNIMVNENAAYQADLLVKAYMESRAIYEREHEIKVRASLKGLVDGLGNESLVHAERELISLPVQKDAFLAYFQEALSRSLLEETMIRGVDWSTYESSVEVDYEDILYALATIAYDASQDWEELFDLFLVSLQENGVLDEDVADYIKLAKEKLLTFMSMSDEELLDMSVYEYLSIIMDLSVEDIHNCTATWIDVVAELLFERNGFEEVTGLFTHAVDAICGVLETKNIGDLTWEDFADAVIEATEEDLSELADMYLINNIPSFAKTLAANKDKFPGSEEDYLSLYRVFTAVDSLIADGFSLEQVLVIADEAEATLLRYDVDVRFYLLEFALGYAEEYAQEFLPDYVAAPILDAIALIRDAFGDNVISEVEFTSLGEGVVEQAVLLIEVFTEQVESGPFTLIEDILVKNQEYLKMFLSDENYASVITIARRVDGMITDGFSYEELLLIADEVERLLASYNVDARAYVFDLALDYAEDYVEEFLPSYVGNPILEMIQEIKDAFFETNISDVDYATLMEKLEEKAMALVSVFEEQIENGTVTAVEDAIAKNEEYLKMILSDEDYASVMVAASKIDEMILNGYDPETLKELLHALWDVKVSYLDDMPETQVYNYVLLALFAGHGLVADDFFSMTPFYDTLTLFNTYFVEGDLIDLPYITFAQEVANIWIEAYEDYAEQFKNGTFDLPETIFAGVATVYQEKLLAYLSEEEINACKALIHEIDQIIVNGYNEENFYAILNILWDVKDERLGKTPEYIVIETAIDLLERVQDALPQDMGGVFGDTAALIEEHFGDGRYFNVDYPEFAESFLTLWVNEGKRYQALYESGSLRVLQDLCDRFEDVMDDYITDEQLTAVKNLLAAVDEMILNGFDPEETREQVLAMLRAFKEELCLTGKQGKVIDLVDIWTNNVSVEERLKESALLFETEISKQFAYTLVDQFGVSEDLAKDLADVVRELLVAYANGEDLTPVVNEFIDICRTQTEGEFAFDNGFNLLALMGAIFIEKGLGYDVDYNEILGDLSLPQQIASIDYNKLIRKALDGKTWEDIFRMEQPTVSYETDDGALTAEVITFVFGIAFDALPISVDVEFALSVEIGL